MLKISGVVVKGKQRGKKMGFPTANVVFEGKVDSGVYSGEVVFLGWKHRAAVFVNDKENLLEAHIFDFSDDLYGKEINVWLHKKIRGVMKFKNENDLIKQIKKDILIIENL